MWGDDKNVITPPPLVTISIPLYRIERKFLERCLNSVKAQTYKNIEVTLINDCTPDNSVEIAENFIQEHSLENWKVYHLEQNFGLSVVRNKGIETANGKYIFFLDSDDAIAQDCIEIMVKIAEEDCLEMVVGNMKMISLINGNTSDFFRVQPGQKTLMNNKEVLKAFVKGNLSSSSCNKLLLLESLKKHRLYFTEGLFAEDELHSFQSALVLDKVGFIDSERTTLYYYLHGKSIIHNRDKRHFDNWQTIGEYIDKALKEEKSEERRILILEYLINYKDVTLIMNWKAQQNPKLWKESYSNYRKLSSLSFWDYFSRKFSKNVKKRSLLNDLPTSLGFYIFKKRYGE